ncbi:hypothetical protein JCM6882_005634 [Rhodosporidiobolus microsporus]
MTTLNRPALDANARLLCIVSSFSAQLDAVRGATAKAVKRCMEDVQELLDDADASPSRDVRHLLTSALSALSASLGTSEPLPYLECARALSSLASALPLLAVPVSPPPVSSPISRLPAELVALIVSFCQDEDLRLRQNTNLALALTCLAFYEAVDPILAVEVHLFTAGQIERVAQRVREEAGMDMGITTLTADLALEDIKRQPDGRWPGGALLMMLASLSGPLCQLKVLKFRFRPSQRDPSNTYGRELAAALGVDDVEFNLMFGGRQQYPSLEELHFPSLDYGAHAHTAGGALFEPPCGIRSLSIGHTAYPSFVDWEDLQANLAFERELYQVSKRRRALQELRTLSLPWFQFKPQDFLPLVIATTTAPPPPLRHLEVTFALEDLARDLPVVEEIFTCLAPSLRRLALRIVRTEEAEWTLFEPEYRGGIGRALRPLAQLEHLEVGGDALDSILSDADPFPSLRHLTLLPYSVIPHSDQTPFRLIERLGYKAVKCLTLCIPSDTLNPLRSAGWDEQVVRLSMEEADLQEIKL